MRNALLATTAAVSLLAVGTAAQAQVQGRQIDISAQVSVLHDSNFARSDEAIADVRGVDADETTITPSIVANISLPVSRQTFYLRGSLGYNFYENNDFLNSQFWDIASGMTLSLGLCSGSVNGAFSQSQSDLNELSIVATKNIASQTTASLNLLCGRSTGFAPSVSVSNVWTDNSAETLQASDSTNLNYQIGLAYRRPSLGTITVFGSHSDTDYDARLILVGLNMFKDGYQTDGFGISYDRHLGARIGGQVSVSYTHVTPAIPITPEFEGWTYLGSVDFRVSSRIQSTLSFSRQATPTIRPGAVYSISNLAVLGATYQMNSRIKLSGGISVNRNSYEGGANLLPEAIQPITEESIDSIYAAASWDIGRRASLAFNLRYEERDANAPGFDYSSTQVGVTAIGKF